MESFDPLVSLSIPHSTTNSTDQNNKLSNYATALTFLGPLSDPESNGDDDDDDSSISFSCQDILQEEVRLDTCSSWIASGHADGACWLWDVRQRAVLRPLLQTTRTDDDSSTILALESLHNDDDRILVHRRNGYVGVYSVESGMPQATHQIHNNMGTFCAVASCHRGGNEHLMVVPGRGHVNIVDWRQPNVLAHVLHLDATENDMVTSLAMHTTGSSLVVCAGMESGRLHCCDVRGSTTMSSMEIGQEPILTLDCATKGLPEKRGDLTILSGLAGNEQDLADKDPSERGRVVVATRMTGTGELGIQARISTTATSDNRKSYYYKSNRAGVAVCRFRPDGRGFGVGGWDHRIRIYDASSTHRPLSVLRGHRDSITAMAWEHHTDRMGLLATGSADGQLLIWNCSSSSS